MGGRYAHQIIPGLIALICLVAAMALLLTGRIVPDQIWLGFSGAVAYVLGTGVAATRNGGNGQAGG